MDTILSSGIELALAAISALFVLIIIFNWRSVTSFLYDSGILKIHANDRATELTLRMKVILLKISGASHHDIENEKIDYLGAASIEETYFAQNKFRCFWQLFSYYMLYCLVMVILAKPIDVQASMEAGHLIAFNQIQDATAQIANVAILALSNVVTDLLSLAITYVHLTKISENLKLRKTLKVCYYIVKDVFFATILFVISQTISNVLYPRAVLNPPADFDPFTIEAALMPYAFMKTVVDGVVSYYPFVFPGQLFITGTVFIPTILAMMLIMFVVAMLMLLKLMGRLQFFFLKDNALLDMLAPEALPETGEALQTRTKRCIRFSVNSMVNVFLGVVTFFITYLLTKIFGLT